MKEQYQYDQSLKQRLFRIFAAIIFLCLIFGGLIALTSCNPDEDNIPLHEVIYDMSMTYDEVEGVVNLKEEISFVNQTNDALSALKFHLYPNAFSSEAKNSPFSLQERTNAYKNGNYGSIEILDAKIDRINCEYEILGEDKTILSLPCSLSKGAECSVFIDSKITLPECAARFGINSQTVNLTGFYPVLCRYENGAWREDNYTSVGDPFYTDISSFYVTATIPFAYVVAASGTTVSTQENELQTVEIVAENVRDFAMIMSKNFAQNFAVASLDSREVEVNYFSVSDSNPQATADLAADAIAVFSSAFGDYPYDTFSVVEAPLSSGGMEYGGLVIVAPTNNYNGDTVVHEIAHQWWYNVVGNDQINAAWLDEGLTEFCTYYYHSLKGDAKTYVDCLSCVDAAYSEWASLPAAISIDSTMNRNLSSFLTNGEYSAVIYAKGALLFDTLLNLVGQEKFNAALKDYYKDNRFDIADKAALIASFEKNDCRVGGIINSWVNGTAKIY